MRALSFLGRSGSGKTTAIERLLPELSAAGIRVVVVKHAHHAGIELEPPGKDTWRFRRAGAAAVALVAPDQVFTLEPRRSEPSLAEVLAKLPAADLAVVESWSELGLDYVAVIGERGVAPAPAPTARCLALLTDSTAPAGAPFDDAPRLVRDDSAGLAAVIRRWLAS